MISWYFSFSLYQAVVLEQFKRKQRFAHFFSSVHAQIPVSTLPTHPRPRTFFQPFLQRHLYSPGQTIPDSTRGTQYSLGKHSVLKNLQASWAPKIQMKNSIWHIRMETLRSVSKDSIYIDWFCSFFFFILPLHRWFRIVTFGKTAKAIKASTQGKIGLSRNSGWLKQIQTQETSCEHLHLLNLFPTGFLILWHFFRAG